MSLLSAALATARRLVLVASFASTSLLNYVFGLAAGWLLGPADFGLLAFAQTLVLIGGLILETGIPWSLTREIARAPAHARAGLVRGAFVANVGLAACLGGVVVLFFVAGPFQAGLEQPSIVLVVCLSLLCIAVSTVARGALQGVERFWAVAAIQVSEVAGKTVAGLALILLGHGVLGALAGFVLGGAAAAGLGVWLTREVLRRQAAGRSLELPRLGAAAPLFGALLAFALLLNVDLLAVKLFASEERALAGYYQAGTMLANLPCYLVTSAIVPLLFARLARAGRLESTGEVIGSGFRLIVLLVLPIELLLIAVPGLAVGTLFPASFAPTVELLRPLGLARAALLVVALLSAAFQAVGRGSVPARVLLSVVGLEVLALSVVVSRWHAYGAAVVAVVACSVALLALGTVYVRSVPVLPLRLGFAWRPGNATQSGSV